MRERAKLESIAEDAKDLGLNIDIDQNTEIEEISKNTGTEARVIETVLVNPFDPEQGYVRNETKKEILSDGSQIKIEVRHRPKCPSCGYVPAGDNEPNHLTGRCSICNTQTCPACKNSCESCGGILCNHCTSGHGLEKETLCRDCVLDVRDEVSHRRELERRDQDLKERSEVFDKKLEKDRLKKEHERKKKKDRWQREKEERDLKRKEWETFAKVVKQLKESRRNDGGSLGDDSSSSGNDHPLYENRDSLYENV